MERHTLSVLVEDVPGTLTRVAGLFARRAFNIHSLAAGQCEGAGADELADAVGLHHLQERGELVPRASGLERQGVRGDVHHVGAEQVRGLHHLAARR